jgi:hypothetical protein
MVARRQPVNSGLRRSAAGPDVRPGGRRSVLRASRSGHSGLPTHHHATLWPKSSWQNAAMDPRSRSSILVHSASVSLGRTGSRMLTDIFSKLVSAVRSTLNCSKAERIWPTTCSRSCAVNLTATGSMTRSASFAISVCMSNPELITFLLSGVPVITMPGGGGVSLGLMSLGRLRPNSSTKERRMLSTLAVTPLNGARRPFRSLASPIVLIPPAAGGLGTQAAI